MTKRLVLLAALALLLPTAALAGNVTFTTSTPHPGYGFTGGMPLAFSGATVTVNASSPGAIAIAGLFSVTGTCTVSNAACTGGETFTFKLTQTLPAPGGDRTFTAKITGYVTYNSTAGLYVITFGGPQSIGGVQYTVLPVILSPSQSGTTADLKIFVLTPEPNAQLLLGLGSIGLMGLALVSRKIINT
jgi:hypothetical protein